MPPHANEKDALYATLFAEIYNAIMLQYNNYLRIPTSQKSPFFVNVDAVHRFLQNNHILGDPRFKIGIKLNEIFKDNAKTPGLAHQNWNSAVQCMAFTFENNPFIPPRDVIINQALHMFYNNTLNANPKTLQPRPRI